MFTLKKINFVHNTNTSSSNSISKVDKDDSNESQTSLKRCKEISPKKGETTLKRCKYRPTDEICTNKGDTTLTRCTEISTNKGETTLKRCKSISTKKGETNTLKRCEYLPTDDISTNKGGTLEGEATLKRCKSISTKKGETTTLKRCEYLPTDDISTKKGGTLEGETTLKICTEICTTKGQTLEVIPFLSNNGKTKNLIRSNGDTVGFDVVLGKHLLICSVSLPMLHEAYYFRAMIDAYSELSRDDFEMVVVAEFKDGYPNNANALFNDFFSGLPCLAIPFSDYETHHSICSFINPDPDPEPKPFGPDTTAILLDPTQTILSHCLTISDFHEYGSEWFPFLPSNKSALATQDEVLKIRLDPLFYGEEFRSSIVLYEKCTLEGIPIPADVLGDPLLAKHLSLHKDILQCDPSLILPTIGSVSTDNQHSLTVSELSNKYVGLYLCADRNFIHDLINVHKRCIANGQELVILVVCVPMYTEVTSIRKEIHKHLKRNNLTWFIYPDNSKVWRRLSRVFADSFGEDEFIILPPNCKNGDLNGRNVIEKLPRGVHPLIDDVYPFTKRAVIEQMFTALRSLTPASLFEGTTKKRTCLYRNGRNVRQSALEGKKLLLYLDGLELERDNGELCCQLMKQYPKIRHRGWEIVFAPLDTEDNGRRHAQFAAMQWPIMSSCDAVKASLTNLLFFPDEYRWSQLIAFDEDGRIVSREVKKRFEEDGIQNSLFNDTLHEEIFDFFSSITRI